MLHTLLKNEKIILASKSPRRRAILQQVGINFRQIPAPINEKNQAPNPENFVINNSRNKVKYVAEKYPGSLIIGADTIVVLNNKIYEKPQNDNLAQKILSELSGECHKVLTGITIYKNNHFISDYETTKVFIAELSNKDIVEYIKTKEPFDKAGAYGIQGYGAQFINRIEGCYFNVMGFPLFLFYKILKKL